MYTMRMPSSIFLLFVSFILLTIFYHSSPSHAHNSDVLCIEKERQALLDFKLSFVGDPSYTLPTWSIHNHNCCDWDGVQCSEITTHVISLGVGIEINGYALRPSILELQHLTRLDLSQNQFTMRIPQFIGSLSKLNYLDLSSSGFYGEIPPQLSNLSRLQYLNLGLSNGLYADNLLWLSHLSFLKELDLSNVDLSKATDWVSTLKRLPTLSELSFDSCSLPPPDVSSHSHLNLSTSLQYLDLSNNSMPYSTLSFLINNGTSNLQSLHLDNAKLEYDDHDEILKALAKRDRYSLTDLSIAGNNLGKLSSQVTMFPSLTHLDASSNRISGSLSEILHHLSTNLTTLYLSANLLNDVISDAHFSKFSQLTELILSDNTHLTFNFSKSWVPPFQLDMLYLRSCKVGPSFPNWILTQKELGDLDISNSMISGAIPDAFWSIFMGLRILNISHNKINSKIPNLSPLLVTINYVVIDLSCNRFHGLIPHFMFKAFVLDLSQNKFSSFPPLHPRNLGTNLQLINLSRNRLTGSLPNWFSQFDALMILNLRNNNLSGTLPQEIGSLWQLNTMHLSNNNFSGQFPLSMKNCTQLAILEFENNKFIGVVPSWIGDKMTQLIVLNMGSNGFSGNMPSSLCHLQSLQILDFSDNKLSGTIPTCFHNFSSMATKKGISLSSYAYKLAYFETSRFMVTIDYASVIWKGALVDLGGSNLEQRNMINLSYNQLEGGIPIGVTTLKELRTLDLSRNRLNGSIPNKIGQLTFLELLKLSSNRLCGEIPESLASLTFLGTLNLSDNNLSGRIPTSTQLRGFDASSYAGNSNLCGQPLCKCLGDDNNDDDNRRNLFKKDEGEDQSFDVQAFLAALGTGFTFGLVGVLGTLHFNRHSRLAFFQLVRNIADWTFVATSLFKSRIERSLNLS